jgi:hypothetical protein
LNSLYVPPHVRWNWGGTPVARTTLRTATAAAVALGLGLLAMSPAAAATDNQAGANAVTIQIADQDGQGTGLATATYDNGQETKTGNTTPAFPDPTGQKFLTGGVLAQEATAKPGFSAACAGLAGDGGSVLNIGDSSCLTPGDLITGSFGSFDPSTLIKAGTAQLPPALTSQLTPILGATDAVNQAISSALAQAKAQFGSGGLVANLDMVEGRCTAGDGGPTGTSTLANAKLTFNIPGQDPITVLDLPVNPKPNTHVFTNLSDVMTAVLKAVDTDLTQSLQGNLSQLTAVTDAIQQNIVTQIHSQVEKNLAPLEQNLLDITLNWQQHPTPDSIKVRALNVDVLPAAKAELNGNPLANLQIGNAACAPVATAAVDAPQAATPVVSPPKAATPTGVSSGLATMPGSNHQGIDTSTWALLALAGLGLAGSAWVGVRRVLG